MNHRIQCCLLILIVLLLSTAAQAQSSSFTYQGQLQQTGEPYTGMANLEFRLYTHLINSSQIGSTQSRPNWPVEDGLFRYKAVQKFSWTC